MTAPDDALTAGLQSGATALATTAAEALAGKGAGIFAGMLSASVFAWFDAQASHNDDALRDARIGALEDEVRKLAERLKKLEQAIPPEHTDSLSREQIFSDFARDVASAASTKKREALVNAAARRFDPRAGSDGVRMYWYRLIASLSDAEIALVAALNEWMFLTVTIEPRVSAIIGGGVKLDAEPSDILAYWALANRPDSVDSLFGRDNGGGGINTRIFLTPRGKIVASFIKE